MSVKWNNPQPVVPKSYKCGFCGKNVAPDKGYNSSNSIKKIYICHFCTRPTYIDGDGQYPGAKIGNSIKGISDKEVADLFEEARSCYSINAFTSAVMCSRKLLMNIAVSEGADEGKSYANYVDYLDSKNYIPPKGKQWVDEIRKLGNEANHKIAIKTKEEAKRILLFIEMLLKFNYEMPDIMNNPDNNT